MALENALIFLARPSAQHALPPRIIEPLAIHDSDRARLDNLLGCGLVALSFRISTTLGLPNDLGRLLPSLGYAPVLDISNRVVPTPPLIAATPDLVADVPSASRF